MRNIFVMFRRDRISLKVNELFLSAKNLRKKPAQETCKEWRYRFVKLQQSGSKNLFSPR